MATSKSFIQTLLEKKNPESNKGFQGLTFNQISLNCFWWRRRESNPRPKILPSSFYMLSSNLRFCPAEFSGTSFLQRYPAKISLLIWQAHLRNYPAESTPFADSAGENQQDG